MKLKIISVVYLLTLVILIIFPLLNLLWNFCLFKRQNRAIYGQFYDLALTYERDHHFFYAKDNFWLKYELMIFITIYTKANMPTITCCLRIMNVTAAEYLAYKVKFFIIPNTIHQLVEVEQAIATERRTNIRETRSRFADQNKYARNGRRQHVRLVGLGQGIYSVAMKRTCHCNMESFSKSSTKSFKLPLLIWEVRNKVSWAGQQNRKQATWI